MSKEWMEVVMLGAFSAMCLSPILIGIADGLGEWSQRRMLEKRERDRKARIELEFPKEADATEED